MSYFAPLGERKLLHVHCCQPDLLKCIILETEHELLKEGRKWGSWSGISHPHSIISHQHYCLHRPTCITCKRGQVPKAANLLFFKARWTHSVFHWYNHLATIFVPSTGLEDIRAHMEAFTKFPQQASSDSQQSLSTLNTKMSLIKKAFLQNKMDLDIPTTRQGCACPIIQRERCMFIPNKSVNVSSLLNHIETQVNALSDLTTT